MRLIAIIIAIIILLTPVKSAVIKGNVYSWELEKIKAVVEINTTPIQRVVAENGSYEFNVPLGVYEIRAYSDGLECNETVVIKKDGVYVIDLILFPNIDELYDEYNFTELNFSLTTEKSESNFFSITTTLTEYRCCAWCNYNLHRQKEENETRRIPSRRLSNDS